MRAISWVWNKKYEPSPRLPSVESVDFLVLGSGIAGLSYALAVAEHGRVAVVTKGPADEGCTRYAQGGICAVLDPLDSVEAHVRDTLRAGAWLNDPGAVDAVCREGPALVLELARLGADFTRAEGGPRGAAPSGLHLTREGGHSARRIVHAADATGAEIERALLARARAHSNIQLHEHYVGIDLVTGDVAGERVCLGADALDVARGRRVRFLSPVTMLATGGAGQLYPVTTNPSVATGDGMGMAARAGARLSGLEFVQFHPTALARMELAPRDVVARAIQSEMLAHGADHVLLDVRHLAAREVLAHFPTIAARCAARGVDITRDAIPVAPAQHYMCGGVWADLDAQTSLPGLFAAGEVACSGLHGANRLASNSLLEGLRLARSGEAQSAMIALRREAEIVDGVSREKGQYEQHDSSLSDALRGARRRLREAMWRGAGIVRDERGMREALDRVEGVRHEAERAARRVTPADARARDAVELRNLASPKRGRAPVGRSGSPRRMPLLVPAALPDGAADAA
ncbi:hypothetical protein QBZ16_004975 [Prototheca wickerhamii]|uniref:L-aspartate oxidase n=1 Tax=Prototheca wickerhamii TaxID=3111 RepID=A0AAD9MMQ1_PROWI|nr:hypothetical protein QBZ16_004975 [Prototheca wickerhamii]